MSYKHSDDQCIAAIRATGGYISQAAKKLGMSFQGLYKRIDKSPKIKAEWDAIKESYLDLAESKVVSALNEGKPWAICFYLKCQGKGRGWVETQRQEITGKDGGPIEQQTTTQDYSKLSRYELRTLQEITAKLNAKD